MPKDMNKMDTVDSPDGAGQIQITEITGQVTDEDLGCDPCVQTWASCVTTALKLRYPNTSVHITEHTQDCLVIWCDDVVVADGHEADYLLESALDHAWEMYTSR